MTKPSMTTYLIEFNDGRRQRVTVPDDWKVTFGPAFMAKKEEYNGRTVPMALRFYESKENQRAIFTGVKNFRDVSIQIEEEKVTTQEKAGVLEVDGAKKRVMMNASVRSWVNPDEDSPQEKKEALLENFDIGGFSTIATED